MNAVAILYIRLSRKVKTFESPPRDFQRKTEGIIEEKSIKRTMSTLIVVIINHNLWISIRNHSPTWIHRVKIIWRDYLKFILTSSEVVQITKFLSVIFANDFTDEFTITKFRYSSHPGIVGILDWFTAKIDDFEVNKWSFIISIDTVERERKK